MHISMLHIVHDVEKISLYGQNSEHIWKGFACIIN